MGLNIKNEEVVDRIRRLADLWGVSLTEAVGRAVENDLERVRRASADEMEARRELARRRLERIRSHVLPLPKGAIGSDHSDLYDDDGLPT